ncbi:MAG: hypothetical protein ACR2NT_11960 [Acidimicrobiia bacterium]|nr:hypothetical protein [Acidimicrobiia bacterium]
MKHSAKIRSLFLRWCDRLSAKNIDSLEELVSADQSNPVCRHRPGSG